MYMSHFLPTLNVYTQDRGVLPKVRQPKIKQTRKPELAGFGTLGEAKTR